MVFYHVDRLKELQMGLVELRSDYREFDDICRSFATNLFPEGMSRFGFIYSAPVSQDNASFYPAITESVFEHFRRLYFPERPSRFQSFFLAEDLASALAWKESLSDSQESIIWEVEETNYFKADALWRDAVNNWMTEKQIVSMPMLYNQAMFYWSGTASHTPRWELIAKLPVRVLRQHIPS